MQTKSSDPLALLFEDCDAITDRWLAAYCASRMRLPRDVARDELRMLMKPIVATFAEAVHTGDAPAVDLQPGAGSLRELEKSIAFLAASLGSAGSSGFDVAALIYSLRDALAVTPSSPGALGPYSEWLCALALDSLASARADTARERIGEQLSDGTPLVQVVPELPAVLLVASPSAAVLDSIFGRLILLCVRVGATAAIIDATGLADQEAPAVVESVGRFLSHQRVAGHVKVALVGCTPPAEKIWLEAARGARTQTHCFPYFDRAVEWGLETAGYRLVRR